MSGIHRFALTCLLGLAGGYLFHLAHMPAAWLSGAMVAVAIASLLGAPTHMPDRVRNGAFFLIGLTMGAGVQPEVLERIDEWPVSMLALVVVVVASTAGGYIVLRNLVRWKPETAFFGAIPGTLSYVLALASERSADLPRIAASQSLRLFILVAILPMVLTNGMTGDLEGVSRAVTAAPFELVLGGLLCLGASWTANRLRIPGGWMTGAFFMSAFLNATGLLPLALPVYLMIPSYIVLGAMIGCRFAQMSLRFFLNLIWGSLAAFAAAFSIASLGAWGVSAAMGLPFGQVLLSYAPGGLEVMTLLAFILDLDPAFVAAHQLVRFIGMVLLLPVITVLVFGRGVNSPAE
ncbi:AbrB family transcriptional regulator [Roseibium sp. RKSG952]|uniref:AbrB family transcriptional regulator n=1 Tax=Roseibium sp. RKSG952 TaxID=2529384 RepID=UPI001AD90D0F|nr:AbrB family transcriptional regulator [Roseibium sp. RKSG952]